MTEWEPATETEAALRDALRANDQELYFRILARIDLLLPVPLNAPSAARAGWGTWTTGGRTHVLAFTSGPALRACLAENAGATRRAPYQELAGNWPNQEWWLAVNPGLPIEGYLPAWFVSQLARGDVRLPGRTMGARARLERAESAARERTFPPGSRGPMSGGTPSPAQPAPAEPTPPPAPPRPTPVRSVPAQAEPARPSPAAAAAEPNRSAPSAVPRSPIGSALSGRAAYADRTSRVGGPGDTPPGWQSTARPAESRDEPSSINGGGYFERPRPASEPPRPTSTEPLRPAFAEPPRPMSEPPRAAPEPFRSLTEPGRPADPLRPPPQPFRSAPEAFRPAPEPFRSAPAAHEPTPEALGDPMVQVEPPVSRWYVDGGRSDPRATPPWAEPEDDPPGPAEPKPLIIEGTAIVADIDLGPGPAGEPRLETDRPVPPVDRVPDAPRTADRLVDWPVTDESATERWSPVVDDPVSERWSPVVDDPVSEPPGRDDPADQPPLLGDRSGIGAPDRSAEPEWTDERTYVPPVAGPPPAEFVPANDVEESLLTAAGDGSTDSYLSTLLLATVLLPVAPGSAAGTRPGDDGFVWGTETIDGETYVVVFTSPERLAEHRAEPIETIGVKFVRVIRRWPDNSWSFAVNPGTPVGAKLPGSQVVGLANWAAEVGLGDDVDPADPPEPAAAAESAPRSTYAPAREDPNRPQMMQKTIAPAQVAYYLDRGYDRVSGFVHRVSEVVHLRTPALLHNALGLGYPGSPFRPDADEVYVLRWPAYRPSLYRIPYGGQNEAAMRAMEGWVIERAPFRGNGFAPGESSDVVAEFKVDSARLPHGAELWRIGADGTERLVATLNSDDPAWRTVGGTDA